MGIGIEKVKKALYTICDVLQEEKEELTEIDSRLGDGDMGISMDKGAAAVREVLDAYQGTDISKLLSSCGAAFNRAAPSTLGTLLSFSMLAVAKEAGKKPELEEADLVRFPAIIADTIAARGKRRWGIKPYWMLWFPLRIRLRSCRRITYPLRRHGEKRQQRQKRAWKAQRE